MRIAIACLLTTVAFGQQARAQSKHSISGNAGAATATVRLSGKAFKTTTSSTSGMYTFSGLVNGGYTVTPSKSGYTFSAVSTSLTLNGANISGVNFVASLVPPPPPPPPTGTILSYGLNEGSGSTTADSSGSSNTGTLNATSWTTGKYGSGLSFDGTSGFISAADSASLDLVTGTVEAWVKLSALGTWRSVFAKGNVNDNNLHNYFLEFEPTGQILYGLGNGATSVYYVSPASYIDTASFHYIAMTWDGSNVRLYWDGALMQTSAQTVVAAGNTSPLYIGQFGGNADRFSGVIDEVRIYNRALSLSEILTDMATPIGGAPPPPPPPPPPPTHSATLNWVASTSSGVVGYRAYRSTTSSGPYFALFMTPLAQTTYEDGTVNAGQTYYYVITALDASNNESGYSNEAAAPIPSP